MPDKTFCQWQAEDEITHPELGNNWEERLPEIGESIGWIFIYPDIGKLVSIPSECPLSCCISYKAFGTVGTVFEKRDNCVDAVSTFVYSGKTEEEMVKNVEELYNWFSKNFNNWRRN